MRAATWGLVSPSATRSATVFSVSVRLAHPHAGRSTWLQCRRRMPSRLSLALTRTASRSEPDLPVGDECPLQAFACRDAFSLLGEHRARVFDRRSPRPRVTVCHLGPLQGSHVTIEHTTGLRGPGDH